MFNNLGAGEILLILVVLLLVFGPKKLPELSRQIGGAMHELRRMQNQVKTELQTALQEDPPSYDDHAPPRAAAPTTLPPADTTPEPDHTDRPAPQNPPPSPDGFDGPPGSFR
jgi:Tat protein translocase TatB subunit